MRFHSKKLNRHSTATTTPASSHGQRQLEFYESPNYAVGTLGGFEPADPQHILEFYSPHLIKDGQTTLIKIVKRDYRRPPFVACETAHLVYRVGLSISVTPSDQYEVVHIGPTGSEISIGRLNR